MQPSNPTPLGTVEAQLVETILVFLRDETAEADTLVELERVITNLEGVIDDRFYDEYPRILQAVIDTEQISMYSLLVRHGIFKRAMEVRDEAYFKHVRENLGWLQPECLGPEEMLAVLHSHAAIDGLPGYRRSGGLWPYLIHKKMYDHMDALLTAGRHIGSQQFDVKSLLFNIHTLDDARMLEILHRNLVPLGFGEADNAVNMATSRAVKFGAIRCADYYLTYLSPTQPDGQQWLPIDFDQQSEPSLDMLMLLDRHAKQRGLDLDTYRDISGRTLNDHMLAKGLNKGAGYLEFLLMKQAEKIAESVTVAPRERKRPGL